MNPRKLITISLIDLLMVSLVGAGGSTAMVACEVGQCGTSYGFTITGGVENYTTTADHTTKGGISYDPSGQDIDADLLDRLVNETEACLGQPIDRRSFRVKFAADWLLSSDGSQEELNSYASQSGCLAKGLKGDAPCHWRVLIACENVLVVPPSMYLLKDGLIRLTTGRNPWIDGTITACANPNTPPLSGLAPIQ